MAARGRRADALTRDAIVDAAVEILDGGGDAALTFRALAARLSTGAGALYWHVANRDELLAAAADRVLSGALDGVGPAAGDAPVRGVALAVFDAMDAHPWIGAQLSRDPMQPSWLVMFEAVGARLLGDGMGDRERFEAASALLNYIVGAGAQNAANAQFAGADAERPVSIDRLADRWAELDAERYSFVRSVSAQMRDHDDRAQFLAGVDLILAGIRARRA